MKQNKKPADKTSGEPCLIVGIGASAGGLNSLECFLRILPDEFGFAVVFMQHLSPTHKSLLPDLLRSVRPDLQIIEITDGLPFLPGKIYLSRPRQDVKIQKGIFHSLPSGKHVHLLIDEFFIALAEEYGDKAVAVIFSGAGTNGSRGTLEIRKKGGTVFVQDPATAEFAEMPLSAIHGGQVDKVLPAEDIAREILKLQCSVTTLADEQFITPEDFDALYTLVREKTGYRFNHYKKSVVERRIRRRMYLHGIPSVRDYIRIVEENDAETASLAADLMIGVTSFFRDPLAWKALRIGVIRKLAAEDREYPLRVWTPACATGEESYSIAMMLQNEFELAGSKREIQVFATDVNDKTLEKAREGKYPASIAADVPPEFMRQFFSLSENGLSATVGKTIRDHVIFARQDLLADPPFSRLDLIICRNLLIYLEPDAQEKCLAIFHYALRDGGYLLLGNAESVGRDSNLFKSLSHKKCRIYSKLETPLSSRTQISVPFVAKRGTAPGSKAALPAKRQPSDADVVQGALIEEYAPAAVAINQNYDIIYHNGPTNRYLQHPRGAPTQNLLELFPENLRNRVRGAVYRASREGKTVSISADHPGTDSVLKEKKKRFTLRVSKLGENLFLIVFIEKAAPKSADEIALDQAPVNESVVLQLESELSSTRTDLQTNIEQLKSANEELQSSNEELQAANEELETSREELQSLNEELITVNAQLQSKMEEQEDTNNDLSNFLSSTNIPTIFLDHLFRVKRFTPAMSRLLKLIPADAGRPIMDMSQENLGPDLISDAKDVLEHLSPLKREIAVKGKWYIRTTLPYRTLNNIIGGVVITYSDIDEIKKAQELTGRLAAIVESADDAIIGEDLDGIITTWNIGAEKIFGYAASEAIGKQISFLAPPDHVDEVSDILVKIARGEHIEPFETFRIRKDGAIFPVSLTFSAIKDGNGRVVGASKIAHDISARKKAEEDLIRAKEDWERTFNTVPDLIAILDNQHHVRRVNKAMADRLGLKPEECIGLPCYKAVHGLSAPPSFCPHSRTVADGKEQIEEVHEDSLGGDFLVSTTPLFDGHGRVTGSVHVAHDITERKKAEDMLRKSHDELEVRVQERTKELKESNELLQTEIAERKRAEETAKTERQRLFDVLETLPVYVVLLTPDYHVPFANRFFRERFGESHGKRCFEYLFGRNEPCEICDTYTVLKTNAPHHWEWTGPDSRNYDIYDFPFTDTDGSGLIMEMGIDITERKTAEIALKEINETLEKRVAERTAELTASEMRLSHAQEIAHLGSWELDLAKKELRWSDEVYRIFGLLPQEFSATYEAFLERVHAEDRPAVDAAYSGSIREGKDSYEIEHRIMRKDTGEIRWVHEKCQHVRNAAGDIIRSLGMIHDITERRQAEESIRRQNAVLEGINLIFQESLTYGSEEELAQSCLAVIEEVTQSRFGFIGEIGADGFLHDIAISDPGWDLCTMYDKTGHRKPPGKFPVKGLYGRVLSDGKSFFTNDLSSHPDSIGTPEGHPPLKAFLGAPLVHGDKTIGMIGVGNRDGGYRQEELNSLEALAVAVVESLYQIRAEAGLRKLTEELKRSNEDLMQFARFASHDLQAPLKTVEGFVKLFIRRYKGKIDEQSDNLLGYITASVKDMQTIIKDLLEFSRIETGSAKLKNVDTSLSLSHALTNLKTEIDENNAEVTFDEQMPIVTGNRTQMIRLFQNLIGNAVKFHGEDPPKIHISVGKKDGEWLFSIRDNGIGIDSKHLERIFDIFRRLHGKSEFPGTGMGLAICKRIVERMRGKIWVESESGKGAIFYFTIPVHGGDQK